LLSLIVSCPPSNVSDYTHDTTVNLVNKDQLDILATLRESVNEDKLGLEADMEKLRKQIRDLSDKNKMQLEQVNALLMEKVNLQSEGIGQREKMLERERDYGCVMASMQAKVILISLVW
jgi:protein HOOK3